MGNTIQHPKKRAFIAAYGQSGIITTAAEIADVHRCTVWKWQQEDKEFAEAMAKAESQAADYLEQEARRRAIEGTLKPVFYKGDECGYIREYSDTLLIALLNAKKPEQFHFRAAHEVTGKNGGPIEVRNYDNLTDTEIEQRIQEILTEDKG
jgi:hypothetical protein